MCCRESQTQTQCKTLWLCFVFHVLSCHVFPHCGINQVLLLFFSNGHYTVSQGGGSSARPQQLTSAQRQSKLCTFTKLWAVIFSPCEAKVPFLILLLEKPKCQNMTSKLKFPFSIRWCGNCSPKLCSSEQRAMETDLRRKRWRTSDTWLHCLKALLPTATQVRGKWARIWKTRDLELLYRKKEKQTVTSFSFFWGCARMKGSLVLTQGVEGLVFFVFCFQ